MVSSSSGWYGQSGGFDTSLAPPISGLLTIPELLLILESIRDFKFHTTAAFMSTSDVCRGRLALFHRCNKSLHKGEIQPLLLEEMQHGNDSGTEVAGDMTCLPRLA